MIFECLDYALPVRRRWVFWWSLKPLDDSHKRQLTTTTYASNEDNNSDDISVKNAADSMVIERNFRNQLYTMQDHNDRREIIIDDTSVNKDET